MHRFNITIYDIRFNKTNNSNYLFYVKKNAFLTNHFRLVFLYKKLLEKLINKYQMEKKAISPRTNVAKRPFFIYYHQQTDFFRTCV